MEWKSMIGLHLKGAAGVSSVLVNLEPFFFYYWQLYDAFSFTFTLWINFQCHKMEIKVQDLWMVWEQKVLKGVWQFKKKKKKKKVILGRIFRLACDISKIPRCANRESETVVSSTITPLYGSATWNCQYLNASISRRRLHWKMCHVLFTLLMAKFRQTHRLIKKLKCKKLLKQQQRHIRLIKGESFFFVCLFCFGSVVCKRSWTIESSTCTSTETPPSQRNIAPEMPRQ